MMIQGMVVIFKYIVNKVSEMEYNPSSKKQKPSQPFLNYAKQQEPECQEMSIQRNVERQKCHVKFAKHQKSQKSKLSKVSNQNCRTSKIQKTSISKMSNEKSSPVSIKFMEY